MAARSAYQTGRDCWGIFNSGELHAFFRLQGHETAKTFVFEPRLSEALRPYLALGRSPKVKRLLVYGRPSIPRNCYPAVRDGLRLWARNYSDAAAWEVVSAGLPHAPVPLSPEKTMVSLGKLPLTEYAALLRESAVGLSLMASPHPSYPPLEMSHFSVKTVTNSYTCKNLSTSHQNIESLADIGAQSIANALAIACDGFQRDPEAGWTAVTGRPSFLETGPSPFLDDVAAALETEVWCSSQDA